MSTAPAVIEVQPVSWETLQASSQWNALSPPRQVWVTAYLSNGGDSLAATRAAYSTAKEKSIKCMSYELRKCREIVDALEFYRGGVTREVLLAECRAQLRRAEPGSVAAQKLLAQVERLVLGIKSGRPAADEDDTETAHYVGELFSQNGQNFKATAVDANGKITAAIEAE